MNGPVLWGKTEGISWFFLSLGRRKLGRNSPSKWVFQYLKGGCKHDGGFPFTKSFLEKTSGNGYKVLSQYEKEICCCKKSFTGTHLLRDMVEHPLLEVFKTQMGRVLGRLIHIPFLTKAWTRWSFLLMFAKLSVYSLQSA